MKKQEEVSIKLVLNNKNLRFKTGELMNVSIHAKCKNIGWIGKMREGYIDRYCGSKYSSYVCRKPVPVETGNDS